MDNKTQILVIDDEEIVHASIKRILSRMGYGVESVFSALEGLTRMERQPYDAVITDLMMPEMNGVEMMHAMKERGINIPTIMVTGYPTIKTAMQALRLGAMDYIPKPFTRQELLSPLNRALRRSAERSGNPEYEEQQPENPEKNAPELMPGDSFYLPEHSWAVYNQDGTVSIGIESSFLNSIPGIEEVEAPDENDLVEQGYPGFKLKAEGEIHGVFMPLSGRVVALNEDVGSNPTSLDDETWVIRIIPSQLNEELESLRSKK